MIFFTVILILFSFLQSTILPFNFILLVLIARNFVSDEKINLYLAFFFGFLLSLFLGYPLGSLSLIYLIAVLIVKLFKKTELATSWVSIIPIGVVLLLFDLGARSLLLKSSLSFSALIPNLLLILPVYFLVRFWEERFVARHEIRLRVGK